MIPFQAATWSAVCEHEAFVLMSAPAHRNHVLAQALLGADINAKNSDGTDFGQVSCPA